MPVDDTLQRTSPSVLVVDDEPLVAETIGALARADLGLRADTAGSVDEALALIRSNGLYGAVLLDFHMPDTDGSSAFRAITGANDGRVAIFSGLAQISEISDLISREKASFILKNSPTKDIISAIDFLIQGYFVMVSSSRSLCIGIDKLSLLRGREFNVLILAAIGLSPEEISDNLQLNVKIVNQDSKNALRKLGFDAKL